MRTLTSIESSTLINASLEFKLASTDGGNVWTFGNEDISNITPVDWRIPFAGGLGKSSTFKITIQTSIQWITENLTQIPNGQTFLNVSVNSDNFQSHSGRVRTISRDANKLNSIELTIFDRFLDNNNRFPPTLSDSYTELHPEVLNADIGKPYYYGKNLRPYYHVAVDCDIRTLIPPTNINSGNGPTAATSVYFQSDLGNGFDITNKSVALFQHYEWDYLGQTITGSGDFEVGDFATDDIRTWSYKGRSAVSLKLAETGYTVNSDGFIGVMSEGVLDGNITYSQEKPSNINMMYLNSEVQTAFTEIDRIGSIYYVGAITGASVTSASEYRFGQTSFTNFFGVVSVNTHMIVDSDTLWGGYLSKSQGNYPLQLNLRNASVTGALSYDSTLMFSMHLKSESYKNYSIYTVHQNCSSSILSDNPLAIQSHIFSENTIGFNIEQSSESQLLVNNLGYSFSCYFDKRTPVFELADEIGIQTQTYMWAADSGVINFRTYQNCADVAINATITTSDIQDIKILDNPLGFSRFAAPKGSEYQIAYDYDFQQEKYKQVLYADKNNNGFCTSASNIGLTQRREFKSKYIMTSDVASIYMNKVVKIGTSNEEFVQVTLPARFFKLELADVVRVEHPAIIGSESVYQITQLNHDYKKGLVRFTAQELIEV